jgi:prolyl-tRNA synthetase
VISILGKLKLNHSSEVYNVKTVIMSNHALIGITVTREENLSEWYNQIVLKAGLIEHSDISGFYIVKPYAYSMWESIQQFLDVRFKRSGVENAYFPLLVTESALQKEKNHIEGFAPEVAWVTRAGKNELVEPLAIRPTSETIIYPYFAKTIRSHRELPVRVNQWATAVRYEMKQCLPFLRSREFLWQEGHTAFATKKEADDEVLEILELYRSVLEDHLAIPIIRGRKSEGEKFAGADYTTTCEAYIPSSGRGIQAATSHSLGQNFAKMFDIRFEGEKGKEYVWQNSWGITTRTIGIMAMVHGDNNGLVLPPRVAPIQVVVVPIHPPKGKNADAIINGAKEISSRLTKIGVRSSVDLRDHYTAPYKYNHWELRGIPIRIEYGARDAEKKSFVLAIRLDGTKMTVPLDALETTIPNLLEQIQKRMFDKAYDDVYKRISKVTTWTDFMVGLNKGNRILVPWCEKVSCEDAVKKKSGEEATTTDTNLSSGAKTLCIPFVQPSLDENAICFACSDKATCWCLFGRSY